ncbi:MAG: hypothetical protein HYW47_06730 [Deltaproteobacteria bacterium]|nr:hypothetical protein [Deltaproteobacteria bacterium]
MGSRPAFFFNLICFFFTFQTYAGVGGYIDDIGRVDQKLFQMLRRWDVEDFRTLIDPETKRLLQGADILPEHVLVGLDIGDIKAAQALFRSDFEKQLGRVVKSHEYQQLDSLSKTRFHEAIGHFKEIRRFFTTPGRSPFFDESIENVFRFLVSEEDYIAHFQGLRREEILEKAYTRQGQRLSRVLAVPLRSKSERLLEEAERLDLLRTLKIKYGETLEKLSRKQVEVNRIEFTRPWSKMGQKKLEALRNEVQDFEKALQKLLDQMALLRNNGDMLHLSFSTAFLESVKKLVGVEPDISKIVMSGPAEMGRFVGDVWVGTCNFGYKTRKLLPRKSVVKAIVILDGVTVMVLAFSIVVPPTKSVVGDFLTMLAFKALWWKYKEFLETDHDEPTGKLIPRKEGEVVEVLRAGELKHDLALACPVCHPREGKDFSEEWKQHGMNELLQIDNPKLKGNLNTLFMAMFYANSAALTEPMIRGRDMYIGILKSVLTFKDTYVTNEILQNVLLLRLGKKAETYEERKMLLQDINASILSNYWIVEFAFFHPIIEPNLGALTSKFLYHQLFQHYLHRQPQIISMRYDKISEFLKELKKKEDEVIKKAKEFGFKVDDISLGDAGTVARTTKEKVHFIETSKLALLGEFLIEQENTLNVDPIQSLDLLPRVEKAREKVEEAFKTKRIYLPGIENRAFIFEASEEGERLQKRKIIEDMIEEVKEMQRNFLENHLMSGFVNINNAQAELAAKLNREFPKTSEELDESLGTLRPQFESEILNIQKEYEVELESLKQEIEDGNIENAAQTQEELRERYQKRYKNIIVGSIEKGEIAKEVTTQKISQILDNQNKLVEEVSDFKNEYGKFIIQNIDSLAQVQKTLETQDEKITTLMDVLAGEFQQAKIERAEMKKLLQNIDSNLAQNLSLLQENSYETSEKLDNIQALLQEIREALKQ